MRHKSLPFSLSELLLKGDCELQTLFYAGCGLSGFVAD